MTEFLKALIPHFKAVHVVALLVWCSGLFALPLMLARHAPAIGQADYGRIRRATHYAYTYCVTPSAVFAIASGTVLIFLRDAYVPWMFAKLVFVAGLVTFHVWVGYVLVGVALEGQHKVLRPGLPLAVLLIPILGILTLVLVKPELEEIPLPAWLSEPRNNQLPFAVPRL